MRIREESGVTLIELLVAMTLGLIVIGGAVKFFTAAADSEPRASSRGADIQAARTTTERITRELRQGSSIPVATGTQLSIVTYVRKTTCGGSTAASTARACRATYSCVAGTCTRTEANPDGSAPGTARRVVSGLHSSTVFSYSPSAAAPTYIGVNFGFPAQAGEDSITISDGVSLRNSGAGS